MTRRRIDRIRVCLLGRTARSIMLSFAVVAIASAGAWLSTRLPWSVDWSAAGRGGLSEATVHVLRNLSEPVHLTAFVREEPVVRRMISQLVERYARVYPAIALRFVDPVREPQHVAAVTGADEGMVLLVYGSRRQLINGFTEPRLTSGLLRVQRAENRFVLFVTGHGERDPNETGSRDVSAFAARLRLQGVQVQTLHLAQVGVIPDNTAALVIASPQVRYLAQEIALIREYVQRGGNVMWLAEPGDLAGLESLADDLGVAVSAQPLLDPRARTVEGADESMALGVEYGAQSGLLQGFNQVTAFAGAAGVMASAPGFVATPLVPWTQSIVAADDDHHAGRSLPAPMMLAVALERDVPVSGIVHAQRIVVAGDGDFLSNAYLGIGGNLELGLRFANWVQQDDVAVNVPAAVAADARLHVSTTLLVVLGIGFLFVLPIGLSATGMIIWRRRQRRTV